MFSIIGAKTCVERTLKGSVLSRLESNKTTTASSELFMGQKHKTSTSKKCYNLTNDVFIHFLNNVVGSQGYKEYLHIFGSF